MSCNLTLPDASLAPGISEKRCWPAPSATTTTAWPRSKMRRFRTSRKPPVPSRASQGLSFVLGQLFSHLPNRRSSQLHPRIRAQSFRALDPMRFPVCQGGGSIGGYGFGCWRWTARSAWVISGHDGGMEQRENATAYSLWKDASHDNRRGKPSVTFFIPSGRKNRRKRGPHRLRRLWATEWAEKAT
jgi:hypothetical protein